MSKYKEILPFGASLLREQCEEVTEFDSELHSLLDELGAILYAEEGRAGLAAPQIGVLKRAVVIDGPDGLLELVNPSIVERRGKENGIEGCLSFAGRYGEVERAKHIRVKYFTRDGKEKTIRAADFIARLLQHEIDHLNGVLYIDHVKKGRLFDNVTDDKVDLDEALRVSGR